MVTVNSNPRFDQKIQEKFIQPSQDQHLSGTYGIVMDYNATTNRASVVVAQKGSEDLGQTFHEVPCPVNMGMQTVAPGVGYPCWVQFKDGTNAFPVVTNFFNHAYHTNDATRVNKAYHAVPKFMFGM